MFKMIIFVLGLALGFGGGVWWAVKNPDKALSLQKQQEEWVLKGKLEALKKGRDALNATIAKQTPPAQPPAGSSILPGAVGTGKPDPAAVEQRDNLSKEIADVENKLAALQAKK